MRLLIIFSAVLGVMACGLSAPSRGEVLSSGVAVATFEHRANSTDLLRTKVLFPSNSDGIPLPGPHPGIVLIQGGLVRLDRYVWIAERLAQAGFVVAIPDHSLDLAFFGIENGLAARELLVNPPAGSALDGLVDSKRLGVMGHSLGGVVAAKLALRPDAFQALVFHASFADGADNAAIAKLGFPSLSVAGRNDCSAKLDKVIEGAGKLASPSALIVLDGVTHYQFTDSDQEDIDKKCVSGVPLATAHDRIALSTVSFFLSALGATPSVGADALRAVPGSEVTVK